jgi:hypothetical protein
MSEKYNLEQAHQLIWDLNQIEVTRGTLDAGAVTAKQVDLLAAALAKARAQALHEAAEVAEAWGAGDTNGITPVEFDRRYGVHLHLAAAIRARIAD